jgi:tripartite-type tricarboxylate transporter receptor subunit TctC
MISRRTVLMCGAAAVASAAASTPKSMAETFPGERTIRIFVPAGPGSPPDVVGRLIASELSEAQGWRLVVENRPGALQTLAMTEVLKQPPDGLSIFPMTLGAMATPALVPAKGLRLETDFAAVALIASGYLVLVVQPSFSAATIPELVALLRARPDTLTFSSGGFGTPAHLIGELFKLQAGVRAVHVPYPQTQQRVADLLSGATQFAFLNTPAAVDLIASGRLRALAVTSPERVAALQQVPTVVEQGFPGLVIGDWIGFAVRSGAPNDAIDRLNGAVNAAIKTPRVQTALAKLGYETQGGTPAELGDLIRSQVAHWEGVVRESGIKLPQQ